MLRNMLAVSAVFLLLSGQVAAAGIITASPKARQLRAQIEQQVERIKRARELADARMDLEMERLEMRLEASQLDLMTQVERLEAIQERLNEQIEIAGSTVSDAEDEFLIQLDAIYDAVQSQIKSTNTMIEQMRIMREAITAREAGNDGNSNGSQCPRCPNKNCTGCDSGSSTTPPSGIDFSKITIQDLEKLIERIRKQGESLQPTPPPTSGRPDGTEPVGQASPSTTDNETCPRAPHPTTPPSASPGTAPNTNVTSGTEPLPTTPVVVAHKPGE